tara:strand:- start:17 stop:196 length:180 start_codon:yes stop_codon:yes gene_type:complete
MNEKELIWKKFLILTLYLTPVWLACTPQSAVEERTVSSVQNAMQTDSACTLVLAVTGMR